MSEPIITKRCSKCKEIKPLSEFCKNRNKKDGYRYACKMCCNKYIKEYHQTEKGKLACKLYRQSEKGKSAKKKGDIRYEKSRKAKDTHKRFQIQYRIHHQKQIKVRAFVNEMVRVDKIPSPKTLQCHYCTEQAKDYHHWHGYAKKQWIDIIPVCRSCHKKSHSCTSNIGTIANTVKGSGKSCCRQIAESVE